jgi:hypothetical protein
MLGVNRLIVLTGIGMLASVVAPWMTLRTPYSTELVEYRGIYLPQGWFVLLCAVGVIIAGHAVERSRSALSLAIVLCVVTCWLSVQSLLHVESLYPPGVGFEGPPVADLRWGLALLLISSAAGTLVGLLQCARHLLASELLTANG